MKRTIILGLAALAAVTQAWGSDKAKEAEPAGLEGPETSIPFFNMHDSIRDWVANGEEGLWIQDAHKQWYYAKVFAPCPGLPYAISLGFKNRALNRVDRDSEIIVPNEGRCTFSSLRKTSVPPPKKDKAAKADKADKASK
jgi:hypothetical protein